MGISNPVKAFCACTSVAFVYWIFLHRPEQSPAAAGWDDLISCSYSTSLDGTKRLDVKRRRRLLRRRGRSSRDLTPSSIGCKFEAQRSTYDELEARDFRPQDFLPDALPYQSGETGGGWLMFARICQRGQGIGKGGAVCPMDDIARALVCSNSGTRRHACRAVRLRSCDPNFERHQRSCRGPSLQIEVRAGPAYSYARSPPAG
jgi:hypothetical protein